MGKSGASGEPPTAAADQPSSGAEGGLPPSGAAGGRGTQTTAGGPPADIPDGSDDDLVARQMREAAEKETDPELKKKLWEEYRKYKQGTR
jgi:DNA-directed RNA polymerase subunit K/omega